MSWLFKLRGDVPKQWRLVLEIVGVGLILILWLIVTTGTNPVMAPNVMPHPSKVLSAYGEMYRDNNLVQNLFRSIGLNLAGYLKALLLTLPLGFLIGLYPLFKGMYQRSIDAVRFVPLAATTSLFIVWFGISIPMKVNFLAFGIFIFLLPIVVQRINEVKDVYLKTVYTIGATDWQTIRSVYIPSVFSKLIDDIRILTAISWTYIVVVETINAEEGGLGGMIYMTRRLSRVDKMFAILIIFIIIGVIQDRIFARLDKELFPHKYQVKDAHKKGQLDKPSIFDTILDFAFSAFIWSALGLYVILALNEFLGFLGGLKVIEYMFGDTCWAFHTVMLSIIFYKARKIFLKRSGSKPVQKIVKEDVSG